MTSERVPRLFVPPALESWGALVVAAAMADAGRPVATRVGTPVAMRPGKGVTVAASKAAARAGASAAPIGRLGAGTGMLAIATGAGREVVLPGSPVPTAGLRAGARATVGTTADVDTGDVAVARTPAPPSTAISFDVASADAIACAASSRITGVGKIGVAVGLGAGSCVRAGVAMLAATGLPATAGARPSPGHSMTSNGPWTPCSTRGVSAATGCARSNTRRAVPATG